VSSSIWQAPFFIVFFGLNAGAWGTLLTAYGLFLGSAVDWLGVKRSLVVCFALGTLSRAIMAATTSATVFTISLLGPNAMAGALGVPVMTIGVFRVHYYFMLLRGTEIFG
jgi:hypothetical protein